MSKEYEYLDDYAVKERFISPAERITEADIINFCRSSRATGTPHTDVEYATRRPFKERIAHGMLTLSVGMVLPSGCSVPYSSFLPRSFIAFYGMDNVRFTAPTK